MAKKRNSNAYGTLIGIMIVLLVLTLLSVVGDVLMDQNIKAQEEENKLKADQINEQLKTDYQQAVAEEREQALIAQELAAQWPAAKEAGWDVVDLTGYAIQNPVQVTVSRTDLLTGGMMLLNHWHSQPADFPESLIIPVYTVYSKEEIPVSGSSVRLFPMAMDALKNLLQAAKEAGYVGYLIDEGYRDFATQQEAYQKAEAQYADKLSGDALVEKTRQQVYYPGTGEYQSGFSFRVDRYLSGDPIMEYKFQNLEMSDWLLAHSWEYGIIFRFPVQGYPNDTVTDKSFKTGETKKMSIYRYVGKANAAVMHIMNFCMEEYIEYLMTHDHIGVFEDGVLRYEIVRLPIGYNTGDVTVTVSEDCMGDYVASIDNMSGEMAGVIVAMSY